MSEKIYETDAGWYLSSTELWQRLEADDWEIHRWEKESGTEWVRTDDEEILELTPVERSDLPSHVSLESIDYGVVVRDERHDA